MNKVTQEMREQLRKPLPPGAVTQHPTKKFLSSIKSIYITERLNDVFGVGSWSLKTEYVTTTDKSMVIVKVIFTIPEYNIYYECYGGNDNGGENSKNFDLGDAYKGSITDALSKICSWMDIGIDVFKGTHEQKSQNVISKFDVSHLKTPEDFNNFIKKSPIRELSKDQLNVLWNQCKSVGVTYNKETSLFIHLNNK